MASINVIDINVLDNPSPFLSPFKFEIKFECIKEVPDDVEWKLTYVGSSNSDKYDQVLDSILVGPIPIGVNQFVFEANAPDPTKIPKDDLIGVTVCLLECLYNGKIFTRVGYYVSNEYPIEEMILIEQESSAASSDKALITNEEQPPSEKSKESAIDGDESGEDIGDSDDDEEEEEEEGEEDEEGEDEENDFIEKVEEGNQQNQPTVNNDDDNNNDNENAENENYGGDNNNNDESPEKVADLNNKENEASKSAEAKENLKKRLRDEDDVVVDVDNDDDDTGKENGNKKSEKKQAKLKSSDAKESSELPIQSAIDTESAKNENNLEKTTKKYILPKNIDPKKIIRNIMADNPRVTRFIIDWDSSSTAE